MLCSNCQQNEAAVHCVVSNGVTATELHLCEHCAQKLARQYYGWFSGKTGMPYPGGVWRTPQEMSGWSSGTSFAPPADPFGAGRFPAEADADFQRRRRLGELRAQLDDAVAGEDYETAAHLRDEIAKTQQQ